MKKTYFKKSISLIMTILMIMSCWVFFPGMFPEASAADGSVNPIALTAIYSGSGDRGDSSKIVICSDGEAGNTTVGHIRFNISGFDNAISNATLTLNTGNHGGTLVSNCRVDVYPLALGQCQATSGTYLVNNIANVYGGNYNSATGVTNALNYYGLTTANRLGTIYQNAPGTHNIDVTSAVQNAKAAGQSEVCFLFIMPEIFNDGNGNSWSDTHINVSGTSLSYTKATFVPSNTGIPIADINMDAANTVIGLDTSYTTVNGAFGSDSDNLTDAEYANVYHNVLYTDGVVTTGGSGGNDRTGWSARSDKTEYGNSWTGSNGLTVYWYHPTATLLYDGDTTNLPRLGVAVNTVMYYTGTWSRKTVNRLSYVASGGNGFNFTQNWHGSDGRLNFQYMWNAQGEMMGYTSTVVNDGMRQTLSGNNDDHFYANLLKFTDSMSSTEYYRSANPVFAFYGDNGDNAKTITANSASVDTIYIINYVPLRTAISDAMTKLQDIKNNPAKYTTASVAKFVSAANALVAAKPNKYINSTLNNVTGWASAAETAVNAYNNVKLELATYDVTYENIFSLSSWANSNSGKIGTSAKGTMTYDVNAGTIAFVNDANNTQSYPNDHYSAHGFGNRHYNIDLIPGEEYFFQYTTSGGTGDQVHIFFYDDAGNAVSNPANRGSAFANAYGTGHSTSTIYFAAPQGATKAAFRFGSTVLGETVTFSNMRLYRKTRGDEVGIADWTSAPIRKVYSYNTALGTTIDVPARTGYTFNGWWVDTVNPNGVKDAGEQVADGTGTVINDLRGFGITQQWILYSEWTINQYTVKFVNAKGQTVSETKYDYGTPASSIAVPGNSTNDYDANKHYSYSWPTINDLGAADVTYTEIPSGVDHSYTYTDKDDTNHTATCACGYSKDEAHSYDGGVINPAPTCTVNGVKTYTCSVCSGTKTETQGATGHTPAEAVRENIVDATCTAEGSYDEVVYCSVCDAQISRTKKTIDKLAHTPDAAVRENEVKATCTAEGSYEEVVYCSACNTELSRTPKKIDILPHTEEIIPAVDATCTVPGKTEGKKCSVCGEILVAQEDTPLADHTGEIIPAVDATCTALGKTEGKKCSVCGEILVAQEDVPMKDHSYGAWAQYNNGTTHRRTCENCPAYEEEGHNFTGEIRKIEGSNFHDYKCEKCDAYGVGTTHNLKEACYEAEATVTVIDGDEANHKVTCKCSREKTEAHTWSGWVADPENKTDDQGKMSNTCEVCSYKKTTNCTYTVTTVDATCTDNGYKTYECKDCGNGYTEILPKLDHAPAEAVREKVVNATCYSEGSYDEVVYCSVCDTELSREPKTIEKIAHTPAEAVRENEKAATCYAEGSYDEVIYCSVEECKAKLSSTSKTIEKIAHTPAEAVRENEKAATCYVEGSYEEVIYCSVEACKHELSREPKTIEKIAHTPAEKVIENNIAPDCENEGSYDEVVYCSVCKAAGKTEELSRVKVTVEKTGHNYTSEVTKEPDCIEKGERTYTCQNDKTHTYTEEIAPLGHIDEDNNGRCDRCATLICDHKDQGTVITDKVDATCEADGYSGDTRCNKCNEIILMGSKTDKLGHDYELTDSKDSTCTVDGYETYTCKNDRNHAYTDILKAPGHTPAEAVIENTVDASCYAEGSYDEVVYCSVCKTDDKPTELSRETKTIEKIAHTPAGAVRENEVAATCYKEGSYDEVVYCSVCAAAGKTEVISRETKTIGMVAHIAGEAVCENQVAATCYAEGSYDEVVYCSVCAAAGKTEVISRETKTIGMVAHTPAEAVRENETPATCTVDGSYDLVVYCSVENCKAFISKDTITVSASGHTEETIPAVEATCKTTGLTEGKKCTVCGEITVAQTETALAPHTEETLPAVEATCNATGLTEGKKCTVCGEITVAQTVVPMVGHSWTAADCDSPRTCSVCGETDGAALGHTWTAATCTTPKTCSACGKTEGTVGGHTVVTLPSKAPTCEEGGFSEGSYCSVCDEVFAAQIKFPATGHIEATRKENIVPSTCSQEGSYDLVTYCATCGKVLVTEAMVIDKLDHTPASEEILEEVLPTCKADGYRIGLTKCSVCGEEIERRVITLPALKHSVVETKAVEPTCETTGLTEGTHCEICGTVITAQKVIPAKGHKKETITATIEAATCTKEGVSEITVFCTVCDKTLSVERKPIPVAAHTPGDEIRENETPATCGKNGKYTSVVNCAVCGQEISNRVVVIPSTGEHDFTIEKNRVEPTCSENGYITYACEGCGTQEKTTLYAVGHNDKNGDSVCDDCGQSFDNNCGCLCHNNNWFIKFIYKIVRFFWKIFKVHKECYCTSVHY